MTLNVVITGTDALHQSLVALVKQIPDRLAAALYAEAELTMTEAKKLCPVDTGRLRDSGVVFPPEVKSNAVEVTMGFGGPASAYALSVHENPRAGKTGGWGPGGPREIAFRWINGRVVPIGAQRKRYSTVGQWKYLEIPFLARQAGLADRIKARILAGGA